MPIKKKLASLAACAAIALSVAAPVKANSELMLVQLTPLGWQVTTSQLNALITNVTAGSNTATTILNNIYSTLNIQRCFGYSGDAGSIMANSYVAQHAFTSAYGTPCLAQGTYAKLFQFSIPMPYGTADYTYVGTTTVGFAPSGTATLYNANGPVATSYYQADAVMSHAGFLFYGRLQPGAHWVVYSGDAWNVGGYSDPVFVN
jgi:hypothetical protein